MKDELASIRKVFNKSSPALQAFDYLIAHARAAAFEPIPASHGKVKSIAIRDRKSGDVPFSAIANREHVNFYIRTKHHPQRMELFEAATDRFGPVPKNSLVEYRKHLRNPSDVDEILEFLRSRKAWPDHRHDRRFVAETFEAITGEHLLRAAQQIAADAKSHGFGQSTDYDLLFQGQRLPPKAVFGVAASDALGFRVRPENFTGGDGATSFRVLREHGYPIVRKSDAGNEDPAFSDDEERAWSEGSPRLSVHLRRERATGLAPAKRDQFKRQHGKLFCERCYMDPLEVYGPLGEACIEVHHSQTHVSEMVDGHLTRLEDLLCLCANCHRIAHRELRQS